MLVENIIKSLILLCQNTRPDHQLARDWEAKREVKRKIDKIFSGPSINIHNSTFLGSDQRIGTINDESFNIGCSKRKLNGVQEKVDVYF
jgi:hypothetical protein